MGKRSQKNGQPGVVKTVELQCPLCKEPLLECDSERECEPNYRCNNCENTIRFDGEAYDARVSKRVKPEFSRLWTLYEQGKFGGTPLRTPESDRRHFDNFLENLEMQPEELAAQKFLEVGFGNGRLLQEIQKHCPASFGIDLGNPLQSSKLNSATVFVGDLHASPFGPGQFDLVVCKGVIQHTMDPARAFTHVSDHVAEGGKLYLEIFEKGDRRTLELRKMLPLSWRYPEPVRLFIAGMAAAAIVLTKTIRNDRKSFSALLYEYGRYKLTIYDDLCCRWAHCFHINEIIEWFKKNGFAAKRVGRGQYVGVRNVPLPGGI